MIYNEFNANKSIIKWWEKILLWLKKPHILVDIVTEKNKYSYYTEIKEMNGKIYVLKRGVKL